MDLWAANLYLNTHELSDKKNAYNLRLSNLKLYS